MVMQSKADELRAARQQREEVVATISDVVANVLSTAQCRGDSAIELSCVGGVNQGRSNGGVYRVYPQNQSKQTFYGVRTAIEQFYTLKNFYTPKNFWLRPCCECSMNYEPVGSRRELVENCVFFCVRSTDAIQLNI